MKEQLTRYINIKIQNVNKDLEIKEKEELNDLENFLNLLIDVKDGLFEDDVSFLYGNQNLLGRINYRYNIFTYNTLKTFIRYLRELNYKSPSFNSMNYTYLLNCVNTMRSKEDDLYEKYDELSSLVSLKEKENEDLLLHRMWLEEVRNKVQNDVLLTDLALIDFISQDPLINNGYKIKLMLDVDAYNKEAIKNYVPASEEDVKKILSSYGYNITDKDVLINISANYKTLTLENILKKMKDLNLRFKDDVLSKILTLGTSVDTIKEAYKKIHNANGEYSLISALEIHNFWIDKAYQRTGPRNGNSSILNGARNKKKTSANKADSDDYELNSSEIFQTAEYLKKYPFYNSSFKGMLSILKLPVDKLIKRQNMFSLYGIEPDDVDGSMALFAGYGINVLDQFIELDLKDYILNHLSTLSKPRSLPVIIYNKKFNNQEFLSIRNNNEYLLPEVIESAGSYDDVLKNSDLTEIQIEKRQWYDDILDVNSPEKISLEIYNVPIINYLEDNYKINELQYKIGNYIFSRKKVLRIATSLVKEEKMNLDLFLYIMTYQRIISKKEVDDLTQTLTEVYELSKKYTI